MLADGRSVRVLRLTSGRRAFLFGPIGLPPRDLTLTVEALAGKRVLASTTVEHVFGLPAAAAKVAPPRTIDTPVQRRVASLPARTGVSSAAWVRDLGNGRTAAYNAGARFPAASTIKLAILLGVLARDDGDPAALVVLDARARARAELVQQRRQRADPARRRPGGRRRARALARRDRDVHVLRLPARAPASARYSARRCGAGRCRRPRWSIQPTFPCCKYTTAHDLGTLLVSLTLAASGHGPALRHGITAREARVVLWLLIHASYPGLVRPAVAFPVGHKAGWLPQIQHDAALVFSPRGTLVAVFMNYSAGGVSYARTRAAAGDVVRLALRR